MNEQTAFGLLCRCFDAFDGEEDSVKEEHADLIAEVGAFITAARAVESKQAHAARVRCTDTLGNVAYVYHKQGYWRCTLANGIPASLSYAGVSRDETGLKFKLDDCETAADVLALMKASSSAKCELV